LTLEKTENKCKDCGQPLRLLEIDNKRGLQVEKCTNCGMLHYYRRNRRGKWQLLKATVAFSDLGNMVETSARVTSLSKNVFLVHGRDYKPMEELKRILQEFGFNPIVLHEQPSGSRTIVEKLEKYSDVGYAFVLLVPDDLAFAKEDYRALLTILEPKKPQAIDILKHLILTIKRRARQNVVLEFGYFIGKLGRDRVCCLYKGDVELPSDMHGIVYIQFKDSVNEVRDKIVKELKAAGYKIET